MRPDMQRVLIQRPRRNWSGETGHPRHRAAAAAPEALPEQQGMRRCHADPEYFSDHLGPLRRFLRKRCGRPWDRVYAEICASCDRRSLRGLHLLRHVEEEVDRPGAPHGLGRFYVDERGLLRAREWRRKHRDKPPGPDVVVVDERLRYERLRGSWFALEQSPHFEVHVWDPRTARREIRLCAEDDPRRWRKRQLSKRELRRLGLPRGR